MSNMRDVGGSAPHDLRRFGTVSPPEHNPQRNAQPGAPEDQLVDPDRPHKSPSRREARRAAERAAKHTGG